MRLFFALWPEAPLAQMLANVAEQCTQRWGGRATRVAAIHMTLAFLGERPQAELSRIIAAAREVCIKPFDLSLDRLGGWRHQCLLWAGCQSPPGKLRDLVDSLRASLLNVDPAFGEAGRRFFPHVTLVRKLPVQAFPLAPRACQPRSWRCRNFVLVRSCLSATGATYDVLETFG